MRITGGVEEEEESGEAGAGEWRGNSEEGHLRAMRECGASLVGWRTCGWVEEEGRRSLKIQGRGSGEDDGQQRERGVWGCGTCAAVWRMCGRVEEEGRGSLQMRQRGSAEIGEQRRARGVWGRGTCAAV
jgi:hypothetical protein